MPVIKITQDDINRSKQPDAGWHLVNVDKFSENDSAKKDSKNWVYDLRILRSQSGTTNKDRFCYARFNSKAPGMIIPFVSAALDQDVDGGTEIDLESLVGKELWVKVEDDVYEGKIQKRVNEFATAAKVPF